MRNFIKLLFISFKFLFQFFKAIFNSPDIDIDGDNNNVTIDRSQSINVDMSKQHYGDNYNTHNNNYYNKYAPQTVNIAVTSSTSPTDDFLIILAIFSIVFTSFTLLNDCIIIPYFLWLKPIVIIFLSLVLLCNLHLFLLSKRECKDYVLLMITGILATINLYFLYKHFVNPELLYLGNLPKTVLNASSILKQHKTYILNLSHFIVMLTFSISLLTCYTRDMINISTHNDVKLVTKKHTVIAMIVCLFIAYASPVYDHANSLIKSSMQYLLQLLL